MTVYASDDAALFSDGTMSLSREQEQSLLAEMVAIDSELCALLNQAGVKLDPPAVGELSTWRKAVHKQISRLDRRAPARRACQGLVRESKRLTWRLALSGMGQVDYAILRKRTQRVSKEDLRQAGILALYRAAQSFEASRGVRFSTYCRYWVKDAINSELGNGEYATRLPNRARRQLYSDTANDKQAAALSRVRNCVELDALTEDGNLPSDRFLIAADGQDVEARLMEQESHSQLQAAINSGLLTPRQRDILASRFGFAEQEERTYAELGEGLGISAERVRQINKGAIRKLESVLRS